MRQKLNAERKRARLAADLAKFTQQYARKAQKGIEPNDRRYDPRIENAVKRMPPDHLDRLLRENSDQ